MLKVWKDWKVWKVSKVKKVWKFGKFGKLGNFEKFGKFEKTGKFRNFGKLEILESLESLEILENLDNLEKLESSESLKSLGSLESLESFGPELGSTAMATLEGQGPRPDAKANPEGSRTRAKKARPGQSRNGSLRIPKDLKQAPRTKAVQSQAQSFVWTFGLPRLKLLNTI